MLGQRILTAALLLPLVLGAIFFLPNPLFAAATALVILLAAKEWINLSKLKGNGEPTLFLVALLIVMTAAYQLLLATDRAYILFLIAALWWLWRLIDLFRHASTPYPEQGRLKKALYGLFLLPAAWLALVDVHGSGPDGPMLVLSVLLLTWVADTAAYFSGRTWGRVKLAPSISPGKTREGVYGAILGSLIWALALYTWRPELAPAVVLIPFAVLLCLVSVAGDLFESVLKRQAGMKDSGSLLPGHGGVLDRIDSLIAITPLFAAGLMLMGGGL